MFITFECHEKHLKNLWNDYYYTTENEKLSITIPAKTSLLLLSIDKNKTEISPKENLKIIEKNNIPLGRYEHFKGKHYSVLYIAKHSETEEPYVVYRQLYGEESVWIRPLSMFIEKVEYKGKIVPRFKYIGK